MSTYSDASVNVNSDKPGACDVLTSVITDLKFQTRYDDIKYNQSREISLLKSDIFNNNLSSVKGDISINNSKGYYVGNIIALYNNATGSVEPHNCDTFKAKYYDQDAYNADPDDVFHTKGDHAKAISCDACFGTYGSKAPQSKCVTTGKTPTKWVDYINVNTDSFPETMKKTLENGILNKKDPNNITIDNCCQEVNIDIHDIFVLDGPLNIVVDNIQQNCKKCRGPGGCEVPGPPTGPPTGPPGSSGSSKTSSVETSSVISNSISQSQTTSAPGSMPINLNSAGILIFLMFCGFLAYSLSKNQGPALSEIKLAGSMIPRFGFKKRR
jgi:hypothetical protein